jgi:hypothetical protein
MALLSALQRKMPSPGEKQKTQTDQKVKRIFPLTKNNFKKIGGRGPTC